MAFLHDLNRKAARLIKRVRHAREARQETAESDIEPDPAVAGSRANVDGNDGSYVGRTAPQFDAEDQQSGAEARSEAARLSRDEP